MKDFKAIKKIRTYMEVVEQITSGLRNKELAAGEKLPSERDLSAMLGIGRQCLREALSVLEVSGIIEVKKGRGTFIHHDAINNLARTNLNTEEMGDPFALMEARKTIESKTAFLAAKMYQDDVDSKELDDIANAMGAAISRNEYAGGELDRKLHLAIANISRNPVYYKLMDDLIANMGKKLWLILKERSLLTEGRNEKYYQEHMEMIAAIKAGDCKLAEKIMLQHLSGVEHDLKN